MNYLVNAFRESGEYKKLKDAVSHGQMPAVFNGLSHIHKVLCTAAYCEDTKKKAVILTSSESECTRLAEDFSALGLRPVIYPARDFTLRSVTGYSREYEHKRIGTLSKLNERDFDVALMPVDAAMQVTLPPEALKEHTFLVAAGDTVDTSELVYKLISGGYTRCDAVEGVGQFAVRGGIIDIYPPDANTAVRLDLWGDEVDKLSEIDVESQRSVREIKSVKIPPAVEIFCDSYSDLAIKIDGYKSSAKRLSDEAKKRLCYDIDALKSGVSVPFDRYIPLMFNKFATVFDYLDGATLFISESLKVSEKQRGYFWQMSEDITTLLEDGCIFKGLDKFCISLAEFNEICTKKGVVYFESFARSSYDTIIKSVENFNLQQSSFWGGSVFTLIDDIGTLRKGVKYVVLAGAKKAAEVLCRELSEGGIAARFEPSPKELCDGVTVTGGGLSAGFSVPSLGLTVITQGKSTGKKAQRYTKRKDAKPYNSLEELHRGDYVVHASHGIGVFDGINSITTQGIRKDYIKIKYRGSDVLYVPVTQLDLVSKYIGAGEDGNVRLHKLGGTEWQNTRKRVKRAVKDMAKQLITLYAKRMQSKGYAFSPDTDIQSDFESRFIYEETEDQLRCAAEIKGDMERAVPMDRLLCGDVGFGKTEVALRAAFKCITEGKQCALLVPTTILAWQHYNTTLERMGNMPVNVEMLSRFRTKRQQTEIIRKLQSGEIDMLIGTHRLISNDVKFRNPGLLIVDEEQRFGVGQKEKLKELFPDVDVLTLSATPIPRTLNMAMSGLRDMSIIEEAPQDRHPVQTYVTEQDNGILYDAIERELRRGGQVYYLHNRVESIDSTAVRLHNEFPDAVIATAHGKMDEDTLSNVWKRLLEHEIDILVCTTIIETGVDVPNANTLIIEDADRMGLSQLHQLRGRVGRSSRRAYAYLCFKRGKALSDIATKRLEAIREYTEFGSGFKIAMRDLEIRGAGNILGGEQHGHMEAVGYDMYLKLLSDAVNEEKGIKPPEKEETECLVDLSVDAHIPEKYIEALPQRLGIYRRISDISSEDDEQDVIDELIDRFGEPPQSVVTLCRVSLLRKRAAKLGITEISQRENSFIIYIDDILNPSVAKVCSALKGRAMLNAGSKPYLAVRLDKQKDIVTNFDDILKIME